jgi:hypothetical protein
MKCIISLFKTLTAALFMLSSFGSINASTVIFSDDFDSYNLGELSGQGGWTHVTSGRVQVVNGPAGSVNTSQVVGSNDTGSLTSVRVDQSVDYDFGSFPLGSLSFDFFRTGTSGSPYSGLGTRASSTTHGLAFIVSGGALQYRQAVDIGDATTLTNISGDNITVSNSNWYRLQAIFDVSTNVITEVWLENLTAESAPERLYFGAATPTLTMTTSVADWDQLRIRTSNEGTSNIFFDNVVVSAVPEPASVAFLIAALAGMTAFSRRRMPKR